MLVKIGNVTFDSMKRPIMLILSMEDKNNISNMAPDATKFLSYPSDMKQEEAEKFMKIVTDDDGDPFTPQDL